MNSYRLARLRTDWPVRPIARIAPSLRDVLVSGAGRPAPDARGAGKHLITGTTRLYFRARSKASTAPPPGIAELGELDGPMGQGATYSVHATGELYE